jgi:hypothetical protein
MNDHDAREKQAAQPEVPKSEMVTRRLRSRPPPPPSPEELAPTPSPDEGSEPTP